MPATRICTDCLQERPITEFRRRRRGGVTRLRQCNCCHRRTERARCAERRAVERDRRVAGYLTRIKHLKTDARLRWLIEVMLAEFGGVGGFANAWLEYHRRASEKGGFAVFRSVEALLRLIDMLDKPPCDTSDLSDEELAAALQDCAHEIILQNPEIAVKAARQLGWSVVPITAAV